MTSNDANKVLNEGLGSSRRQSQKAGWSWGCVSALHCEGRTIWIADAHRGDGKRFIVRSDEMLTAFVELERAIHEFAVV